MYKLKNRDYDVVAFDFPGCGLSTSNSEITIQYYQKIALEFVNKINYKFDLVVAHSLGGASALYLLNNKIVKKALLAAPINYNLLSTFANETIEQGIKRIARWLVPKNYNDALESSDNLIYGNKLNYRKNITQKANAFLKLMEHKWMIFDKLVSKEILNPRYHKKIIKDLYAANNDYSFITGTMDKFVPFLSVAKIANEYNKDLIGIKDCGHAIFLKNQLR
ncbi:alpha/beta hydrolase [Mycoplasmopsis cynos]|nr:alpha/beta hydrolase [Mycoplasmopsis cynos]